MDGRERKNIMSGKRVSIVLKVDQRTGKLTEGIVQDADLVDAGAIFGTGFAPFRGGPLYYLEKSGAES